MTRLTVKDEHQLKPAYLTAFLNRDLGKFQLIYSGYGSTRQELTHGTLRKVKIPILKNGLQQLVWEGLESLFHRPVPVRGHPHRECLENPLAGDFCAEVAGRRFVFCFHSILHEQKNIG